MSDEQHKKKQDEKKRLYRQIVQRTSDAFLLERMRLHGFWPKGEPTVAIASNTPGRSAGTR